MSKPSCNEGGVDSFSSGNNVFSNVISTREYNRGIPNDDSFTSGAAFVTLEFDDEPLPVRSISSVLIAAADENIGELFAPFAINAEFAVVG